MKDTSSIFFAKKWVSSYQYKSFALIWDMMLEKYKVWSMQAETILNLFIFAASRIKQMFDTTKQLIRLKPCYYCL